MASFDLRSLETFRVVAETGSATAAAALLNSTQPSVTRAIADLEKHCGFALFERGHYGMRLTPEGEVVLGAVRRSLAGLKSIQRTVDEVKSGVYGELSASTIPIVGEGILMDLVAGFLRDHPRVRVKLALQGPDAMFDDIAAGTIDFGAVVGPVPDRMACTTVAVGRSALMLAVPLRHRLAAARRATVGDLDGERLVLLLPQHHIRAAADLMILNAGIRPSQVHETSTQRAAVRLVELGGCISFVDSQFAADLDNRRVATVPLEPAIAWDVNLVHRGGKAQSKAFASFLEWLKRRPAAALPADLQRAPESLTIEPHLLRPG